MKELGNDLMLKRLGDIELAELPIEVEDEAHAEEQVAVEDVNTTTEAEPGQEYPEREPVTE